MTPHARISVRAGVASDFGPLLIDVRTVYLAYTTTHEIRAVIAKVMSVEHVGSSTNVLQADTTALVISIRYSEAGNGGEMALALTV